MSRKLCRLCFTEKARPIDIFGAEGIKRNMADAIRMHFPDEVSETDDMPKSVCRGCWAALDSFHKFYDAVNGARHDFLLKFVKLEEPNFVEVECGTDVFDHDVLSQQQVDNLLNFKEEMPSIGNDGGEESAQMTKPEIDSAEELDADVSFPNENDDSQTEKSNSELGDEIGSERGSESDSEFDDELHSAPAAYVIAAKKAPKISIAPITDESNDHLIANYMDMHCEICKMTFATLQEVYPHLRDHNKSLVSMRCCKRRIRLTDIRGHIQFHLNPDTFKCEQCNACMISRSALLQHMRSHESGKYKCDVCDKKFVFPRALQVHLQNAGGRDNRVFECSFCDKRFHKQHELTYHAGIEHKQDDKQVCHMCGTVCESSFLLCLHLKQHSAVEVPKVQARVRTSMRSRNADQSLQCPKCGKTKPNRNALSKHISTVHNYKLDKCHLCDKVFKQRSALKEHIATHTGEILYTCEYCPKRFKWRTDVYKHYKRVHPEQRDADRKARAAAK